MSYPDTDIRKRIVAALEKPMPPSPLDVTEEHFDPWGDIITGIYGNYAKECDDIMIEVLIAAQNRTTFSIIETWIYRGVHALRARRA